MTTDHELVKASYGRCCISPKFLDDFYATFTASSPTVREKLKNTDMAAQKALLRSGISFLIMFAGGSAHAASKVTALGKSHSKGKYDIPAELYALWLNALIATVAKHDTRWNAELEAAWRQVLALGVAHMQSLYLSKDS